MIIHVEDPERCVPPFCEKDIDRKIVVLYLKNPEGSIYFGYATKEHNYSWNGAKIRPCVTNVNTWHADNANLLHLVDLTYKVYGRPRRIWETAWICDIAVLETQSDFQEFLACHNVDVSVIHPVFLDRAGRLPP